MTNEEKQALIEVATKRLNQSRKMAEAKKGSVRPRGGIEIDYGINIALMEIALAALTSQPVKLPDISAGKYYTEEGSFKAFDYKRDLKDSIRAAGYEVQE